jgi:hypothetical protein
LATATIWAADRGEHGRTSQVTGPPGDRYTPFALTIQAEANGRSALGCCTAHPNYDMTSGWSSLNIAALADAATRAPRR